MQKRKAAANVFMEQNIAQRDEADADDLNEGYASVSYAAPTSTPIVQEAQQQLAQTMDYLSAPPAGAMPMPQMRSRRAQRSPVPQDGLKTSEELQLEKEPIRVRETGVWLFKRVIVPPNVYVVHTRIGSKQPVTLGLGLSFRYNPETDAYLVVPAAMQTIGIVANSISKEKQGINILAYVQWQIDDFSVAYRKLDFSDSRDPLGIVNAQLREQAEAAIKDKIATMSVEEVLTDKEPIIAELTARLKAVAEGRGKDDAEVGEGLGIKIVTVQIKEAFVSSQRLWEHLQAPFRYEQEKIARISHLRAQDEIRVKELQNRKLAETSEAETLVDIERIKQSKQTEAVQLRLGEESTRFVREQESVRERLSLEEQTTLARQESQQRVRTEAARLEQETQLAALRRAQEEALARAQLDSESSIRQKALHVERALQELAEETRLAERRLQAERERLERETELGQRSSEFNLALQAQEAQLRLESQRAALELSRHEALARLELDEARNRLTFTQAEQEVALERERQQVRNLINEQDIASRLVAQLPELAEKMPEVHELRVLQTGADNGAFDALPAFLAKMLAVAESLGVRLRRSDPSE